MKKYNPVKSIMIPVAVFILLSFFFLLSIILRLPSNSVDITGTSVDNNYNNLLAGGNLVRIGDKLYYNYKKSEYAYGLIEMSLGGSKRIYWEGIKWFGSATLTQPIYQHDGQLIMALDNQIKYYSSDTSAFEVYEPLNHVPGISLYFQSNDQSLFYLSTNVSGINGDLCSYSEGLTEVIAHSHIQAFYVLGEDIYYYRVDESGSSGEFRKFNSNSQADVTVCSLDGYSSVFSFIIEGDSLIFGASRNALTGESCYSIYRIDLKSSNRRVEAIYTGNEDVSNHQYDICSWNVYSGKVYVASHSGLIVCDLSSGDTYKLCDMYVGECYIVDDLWIYYVDIEGSLWRVTNDGSTTEKVF